MITSPPYPVETVRADFPLAERLIYLNHASISPVPAPVYQAMQQALATLQDDPMAYYLPPPEGAAANIFVTFSTEMAALIHAEQAHEVVGIPSTSSGLNTIAQAIDWQPGDNVVLVDVEFPSNVYPWMALARRGVECRLAPAVEGGASPEAFAPYVDERTRVVAVSAVQYLTGHRADLAALGAFCRKRGILFVVDAIQAVGHTPIDVQAMQIDVLATGGQKSLMGPPGQGFLYVREAVCEQMRPGIVGPNATVGWEHWAHYDLTPRPGALRFMMGTTNLVGMVGLIESVRYLRRLGLAQIDAWTRHLTLRAMDRLRALGFTVITPSDPAHVGPIVTFRIGDGKTVEQAEAEAEGRLKRLMAGGIRVTKHWDARRWPHLRVSVHCYNTEDDLDRFFGTLGGRHE